MFLRITLPSAKVRPRVFHRHSLVLELSHFVYLLLASVADSDQLQTELQARHPGSYGITAFWFSGYGLCHPASLQNHPVLGGLPLRD